MGWENHLEEEEEGPPPRQESDKRNLRSCPKQEWNLRKRSGLTLPCPL